MLRSPLAERNGKVSCNFDEAPVVRYNPGFIRSIFGNLISNAINYADESRNLFIEIRSHRKGGHILFTVKDNGTGIDLDKYRE